MRGVQSYRGLIEALTLDDDDGLVMEGISDASWRYPNGAITMETLTRKTCVDPDLWSTRSAIPRSAKPRPSLHVTKPGGNREVSRHLCQGNIRRHAVMMHLTGDGRRA